jgi:putative transposase
MDALQEFIRTKRDSRELKRALAVQNTLAGRPWAEVASELGVTESFISKWRARYKHGGVEALRLGYKGSAGYLQPHEKQAVITWIQAQEIWNVQSLQQHIMTMYGIQYKSQQSYYALFNEARISWKKLQDRHPKADPKKVAAKRTEIYDAVQVELPSIVHQQTIWLFLDECHLLWGDACGYAWGPRNERVYVPIENIKTRQTYYGALNLLTGRTVLWEATAGNKENTVGFLKYLRQRFQGRRMVIIWDGASYHTAHLVQDYVGTVNGPACPEPQRRIQLIRFAPHAPAQNPIEDVWLAGKRQVRKQWADLTTFADVKQIFSETVTKTNFDFHKLDWYGRDQIIAARREQGFRWE